MRIKHQIFTSLFIASLVVSFSVFLILEWGLYRNHLVLTKTINRERLAALRVGLEEVYAKHGGLEIVAKDAVLRYRLFNDTLTRKVEAGTDAEANGQPPLPRPLPYGPNGRNFDNNIVLLDAFKRHIWGPAINGRNSLELKEVYYQGKVAGYLGLSTQQPFISIKTSYQSNQHLTIILVTLVTFAISIGVSMPLANRLIRPVNKMTTALHAIASGAYDTRVENISKGELGQLERDFNHLAMVLEKHKLSRCQFAADISHELRTSLTILRAETEAIVEGILQTTPETIGALHGEILQLNRLVDDIYQLSLTDSGTLSYSKQETRLSETLLGSIDSFKTDFLIKEIDVSTDIKDLDKALVHADSTRLRQLFDNLLINSLKYTNSGGALVIQTHLKNDYLEIDFLDSEPGVPTTALEQIFERFFRLDKSRNRATGGAGLGLAICRNIVEAHNGKISAHESPLGGLCVKIELPISERLV